MAEQDLREEDLSSVAGSLRDSALPRQTDNGSATPSAVLAPCIVAFQLGAILEQLRQNYSDQPEWTAWVTATMTSASHWISRAHLAHEGVAIKPDDTREASKRVSARATEPNPSSNTPSEGER
jgi:hypothetical protein